VQRASGSQVFRNIFLGMARKGNQGLHRNILSRKVQVVGPRIVVAAHAAVHSPCMRIVPVSERLKSVRTGCALSRIPQAFSESCHTLKSASVKAYGFFSCPNLKLIRARVASM